MSRPAVSSSQQSSSRESIYYTHFVPGHCAIRRVISRHWRMEPRTFFLGFDRVRLFPSPNPPICFFFFFYTLAILLFAFPSKEFIYCYGWRYMERARA